MTAKEYLEKFSTLFDTFTRTADSEEVELVTLKSDAPSWALDVVREAHGDFGPDDYRYRMIEEVADRMLSFDAPLDADNIGEICDGLVDIYNHDLLQWLGSSLRRAFYHDDAQEEGLIAPEDGLYQRLMVAQYMEYKEIAYSLIESFNKLAEENEDGE